MPVVKGQEGRLISHCSKQGGVEHGGRQGAVACEKGCRGIRDTRMQSAGRRCRSLRADALPSPPCAIARAPQRNIVALSATNMHVGYLTWVSSLLNDKGCILRKCSTPQPAFTQCGCCFAVVSLLCRCGCHRDAAMVAIDTMDVPPSNRKAAVGQSSHRLTVRRPSSFERHPN